jgi:hypothetical protein
MKHFTIENETNNITVHGSAKDAEAVPNTERFSSEAALLKLAGSWPATRLVEIWNSLPGETPVKRFKDRATAVSRIWKAIQNLGQNASATSEEPTPLLQTETAQPEPAIAESTETAPTTTVGAQAPDVAPAQPASTKQATRTKKAATVQTGAPREGTKASQVIAMLKREGGTTLEEIMSTMGWLKHTTRAMLSAGGSLTKKHRLTVISEKIGDKRVYSIKS